MSTYTPYCWSVVEISKEDKKEFRILGCWYGGFSSSDSWRLSSSITDVVKREEFYEIHNASGSTYKCCFESYKLSMLGLSVYNSLTSSAEENGQKIRILDYSEIETLNFLL
jgi:hypothetical protein